MSSLYKRANARQKRILRIVEGAVKNAVDAHPDEAPSSPARFARSVAKRAAGTLTAQWPDVLAAALLPVSPDCHNVHGRPSRSLSQPVNGEPEGRASRLSRRSPFPRLYKELSWRVGAAKYAGRIERQETLIEVLRLIDKIEKGEL